jgi:hypothetical protein
MSSGGMSGGAATAGHCTPGTPQPAFNLFGNAINPCSSISGLPSDANYVLDIALTTPVGPGQTFAFSVDMHAPEGDFEMYGATSLCGAVGELLSTVHVTGDGILCHEAKPMTGTYSHMIWVWHTAGEMKNTAICESGTCPAH